MARVLVSDDEAKLGTLIAEALTLDGHSVVRVAGGRQALVELAARCFDIVLTDLRMPEVDGFAVLQAAKAKRPAPEVLLLTAYGTAESAVAAMKAGAADYLTKPFSIDELRLRVSRLAEQKSATEVSARLVGHLTPSLVAQSGAMQSVLSAARQVASTDTSVLLLGESGTGKSQLARFIHYSSKRASAPLVEIHCAALPEGLLESELFGHEKGAFTDARERREGHLAAADGGTLLLDEIGEVTPMTQVKLLRFLQEHQFVPIGSVQPRDVNVRIIAATNRDLPAAVKAGAFREDLFYRLNVFSIEVPPLRNRPDDVSALIDRFLLERGLPLSKLSASGRQRLLQHRWPGNVRELENALERALILAAEEEIGPQHFSNLDAVAGNGKAPDVLVEGFSLDAFEREIIYAALERSSGNKTLAAKLLGITRRRLYSLLQSLQKADTNTEG